MVMAYTMLRDEADMEILKQLHNSDPGPLPDTDTLSAVYCVLLVPRPHEGEQHFSPSHGLGIGYIIIVISHLILILSHPT